MKPLYLIPFLCIAFAVHVNAQDYKQFEKHMFESKRYKGQLPYRFLKPAAQAEGKTWPLVLFLHGAGERGNDNKAQLLHGVHLFATDSMQRDFPAFVIAPQCPEEKRWVDIDWSKKTVRQPAEIAEPLGMVMEIVQAIIRDYPVDPSRIYVTGLSMGGFGTWDLLARYPGFWAAAAPVCGGADILTAPAIKDIPIWNFHGAEDPVVPVSLSRDMTQALRKADGFYRYTEIPGMEHNAWDAAYPDMRLYEWMFRHRLKQ